MNLPLYIEIQVYENNKLFYYQNQCIQYNSVTCDVEMIERNQNQIDVPFYQNLDEMPFDEGILYFYVERNFCKRKNDTEMRNFIGRKVFSTRQKEYITKLLFDRFYDIDYKMIFGSNRLYCIPV